MSGPIARGDRELVASDASPQDRTQPFGPGPPEDPIGTKKPSGAADLAYCLIPGLVAVALCIFFRPLLTSGLWWDEQWRAYHVVLPGLHLDLSGTYAPTSPAWLLVDKLSVAVFGVKEWALRLPSVVAWILTGPLIYPLCRRIMGRVASIVTGTALAATPAIVYFGTELKPYATEMLATVAIILAWAKAHERHGKQRVVWYGVMALVSLLSVPAIFVVAPLLALDVIAVARTWRERLGGSPRLLAIVAATSAAVVAPLAVTVLPQPAGAEYSYFNFLPSHLWQAVETAARQIGEFLAAAWTSASMIKTDTRSVPLDAPAHVLFVCTEWGVAVLVILGAWHVRHRIVGRGLTSVLVGGFSLQVVTSLLHLWPLGIARVNLFLLPVVYVLTVAGLACVWDAIRNSRRFVRAIAALIGCAGAVLAGAVLVQDTVTTVALHRDIPLHRWDQNVRLFVEDARRNAVPGAVAIVQMDGTDSGFLAEPTGAPRGLGWIVYMDHYDYATFVGNRIPLSRTFFADIAPGSTGANAFLADHRHATRVVEYAALQGANGGGSAAGDRLTDEIRSFGFVPYLQTTYEDSGQLTMWRR